MHIYAHICYLYLCLLTSNADNYIDLSRTLVWGPGLQPQKIRMRSRYFFVQLVNSIGQNVTEDVNSVEVTAQIFGQSNAGNNCRVWVQTLNCKDGSFIIRYRVYETCYNFHIKIIVNNEIIPNGIIHTQGVVHEEECICPAPSMKQWMDDYKCSPNLTQIHDDLKYFPSINFDLMRTTLIKYYDRPHSISLCHYVIKGNKIFRRCYGEHTGFKSFSDSILLSLARKVLLPDTEFFMNLGDWPIVPNSGPLFPIFSWCGSIDTRDIILPTYDITESSLENMGRVLLDMLSVQGNTETSWSKKVEKLFWRGRDSRRERLYLIDISRNYSNLFNVSITNFFFFKSEENKYRSEGGHISFFDFFQYKYLLNIDGTVAAYRLPYLLAGDSVIFKQDSKYYEHFYHALRPYIHYIPIKRDLSDLVEKIKWAKKHDDLIKNIAKNGRALMREIALPQNIFCYYALLLQTWSKKIQNVITVFDDMEEVQQHNSTCQCYIPKEATFNKDEL